MDGKGIWGKKREGDKGKEGNALKDIQKDVRGEFPGALLQCFKKNVIIIQAITKENA
jgi:hypothetical protein